eukprot:g13499.t1
MPCLPLRYVAFMNQFVAIRSLTESLLECLPQLGLQIYMLVWCGQEGIKCNFVETGNNALYQALLSSGISIMYKIARVHFVEKKKATWCEYVIKLGKMGSGLPLREIRTNQTGDYLHLGGRDYGDTEAILLASVLATNTSLEKIYLSYNNIGSEGAKALAKTLATNTSLRRIDFYSNNIGDEGAKALAEALATNTSLKQINLGENKIGDGGAKALKKALATNTSLKQINLGENKIGDGGAKALKKALATNTSLKQINLGENKISDVGAEALKKALATNTSLKVIWLSKAESDFAHGSDLPSKRLKLGQMGGKTYPENHH